MKKYKSILYYVIAVSIATLLFGTLVCFMLGATADIIIDFILFALNIIIGIVFLIVLSVIIVEFHDKYVR